MEDWDWLYYSLTITLCLALSMLLSSLRPATAQLPPGPPAPLLWFIAPLLFLSRTNSGMDAIIRAARSRYGHIFTLYLHPARPTIFVVDRAVAHRVLVQSGAAFADRPPASLTARVFTSDQHNISSGAYGSLWSLFRRNLSGRMCHPSCLRRYAGARRRALAGLVAGVTQQMRRDGAVVVEGLLRRAMVHVAVSMCFGEELATDGVVASVEGLYVDFSASVVGFQVFNVCPAATKVVFRRRWKRMLSLRRRQEELFVPLIRTCRARAQRDGGGVHGGDDSSAAAVVDVE